MNTDRAPSAHSMTVETTDRENLAEKVFLLEQWKAKAVQTFSQLESERDEAVANEKGARDEIIRLGADIDEITAQRDTLKHNLDGLLVAGFNTPPSSGCAECCRWARTTERLRTVLDTALDQL